VEDFVYNEQNQKDYWVLKGAVCLLFMSQQGVQKKRYHQ